MRSLSLIACACLTLTLLLFSAGEGWSADLGIGLDAARRGDFATALREWTPLAEQGHVIAQYNLGLMYRKGDGVPQDYATAVKWYTLAAEQGNAFAQSNLGLMYANGEGVPQDYVYAHMWWNIAASSGNEGASKNRDIVAERMTPADLSAAQRLTRECVAKNYKGC
jgi:TPR repeat protein